MINTGLISWFGTGEDVWLDHGDATEFLHSVHPKTVFVKTLRRYARMLDVGAGDGTIEVLRRWPKPERKDLKMYAYAMERGECFAAYDGYELGMWPGCKPNFDGMEFDAILCSHFIEHIPNPLEFVDWAVSQLAKGGRLYLEWPSEASKDVPTNHQFRENGIDVVIGNFHDDPTHLSIPLRTEIVDQLQRLGMVVYQQGINSNPYIEEEMIAHHKAGTASTFSRQVALWSRSRWAQYVVAEKG